MIVYCCTDLIFATKIHSTAESLGVVCRPARDEAALRARLDRVDDGKANDAVEAVMIDLTMGEVALELIGLAKGHDAGAGASPGAGAKVIAFAPHVEVGMLKAAEELGADQVMPRGAFAAQLPQLLGAYSTTGHPPGSLAGPDGVDVP